MSRPTRSVEVSVEGVPAPRWKSRLPRFCARVMDEAGFAEWAVAVLLCGDPRIAALNGRYRGRQEATDVLSFPADDGRRGSPVVGDIAISLETLRRNAASYGVSEEEELKRLLVHGILHLAGMDHGRGKGGAMLSLQGKLLQRLEPERIMGG